MDDKNINIQFKILYVIAILSVLELHIGKSNVLPNFNFIVLSSYAIALFGFISGYFYKEKNEKSIIKYIRKKFIRLMIPFFIWNLLYGILTTFLQNKFGLITSAEPVSFKTLFLMPLYNTHEFRFNLASWFVPALFIIEIINILFRKLLNYVKLKNEYVILLVAILLNFFSVYLSNNDSIIPTTYDSWRYLFYRILFIFPFYELGIFYNKKLENKMDKIPNTIYLISCIIMELLFIFLFNGKKSFTIVWAKYKQASYFLPFAVALPGIFFYTRISKILVPVLKESKIVNSIYKYGYSIMVNQFMGTFLLSTCFAILAKFTLLCQSFNYKLYSKDVYYFYCPKNIMEFKFIYLICAILVSIFLAKVYEFGEKSLIKYGRILLDKVKIKKNKQLVQ